MAVHESVIWLCENLCMVGVHMCVCKMPKAVSREGAVCVSMPCVCIRCI